ncbi:T9SS type A sorting domain-containing protein [Ekhidna sp.]
MYTKKKKFIVLVTLWLILIGSLGTSTTKYVNDPVIPNPILFGLFVPPLTNSSTFGHPLEPFTNISTDMVTSPRGGDLALMNTDGSVRFLTKEAGFGVPSGEVQSEEGISVRQPCVHWDGCKALFSMVIGGPTEAFDQSYKENRWQIWEVTNLCDVLEGATPNIIKVENQPEGYNNTSPIYGITDNEIFFTSDNPYNDMHHTYPQRDRYESSEVPTGIWKLNRESGVVSHLTHAADGDFDLTFASDGRLLFIRWAHEQRDQQAEANRLGDLGDHFKPHNFVSEAPDAEIEIAPQTFDGKPFADENGTRYQLFPEPRSESWPDYDPNKNTLKFNEFQIWEILPNGERNQTILHSGRHDLGGAYTQGSFLDDPNFATGSSYLEKSIYTSNNEMRQRIRGDAGFFQVNEDHREGMGGNFYFVYSREFTFFAAGTPLASNFSIGTNPEDIVVRDISGATENNQYGRFRDIVMMDDGSLVVSHTDDISNYNREEGRVYHLQLNRMEEGSFEKNPLTGDGFEKEIVWWGDNTEIQRLTVKLMEAQTEPIVARSRPAILPTYQVDPIEQSVIEEEGVNIDELRAWLIENDLAMITVRNLTSRDRNDFQQPYNLRVPGGTSTIRTGDDGKVYDISHFQPFVRYLERGYQGRDGRRTFPLPFKNSPSHPNLASINPYDPDGPANSIKIEPDGSVALFVPATRSLSWWTKSPENEEVVVERQDLTFAPGEIMTCPGCHGINKFDQAGNAEPTNKPESLRKLMRFWKNRYGPNPLGLNNGEALQLFSSTPNPFTEQTTIRYGLIMNSEISIQVYDMMGRQVRSLENAYKTLGEHEITWDGKDKYGSRLKDGIYILKLTSKMDELSIKVVLRD